VGQIINIYSEPPKTEFAPNYIFNIYQESILDYVNLNYIRDTIISKEKQTIEETQYQFDNNSINWKDGDTGLGANSLTSRSPFFNLLDWPEMKDLKLAIRFCHDNFLKSLNLNSDRRIFVQCWANVMRQGQQISLHSHDTTMYGYLGGHISVEAKDTSTYYIDPYNREEHGIPNQNGLLTFFPNWMQHRTDMCNTPHRITIAFDMMTEIGYKEDIYDNKKHHWVEI
jgi:hypothetical protein